MGDVIERLTWELARVAREFEAVTGRPLRSDIDYCTNHVETCMIPGCRVHD